MPIGMPMNLINLFQPAWNAKFCRVLFWPADSIRVQGPYPGLDEAQGTRFASIVVVSEAPAPGGHIRILGFMHIPRTVCIIDMNMGTMLCHQRSYQRCSD